MSTEYILIHDEPSSIRILFEKQEIAKLRNLEKGLFKLSDQNQEWLLNRRVDGEIRPFSIVVLRTDTADFEEIVLKIKDHIFLHNGYFYMLGGIPEGRSPRHHLMGSKHICRLTNFPFSHPDQIDAEAKNRLKKHRGVSVGEIFGLGSRGFHVKLEDEVNEIGLPLAACAYLIYSSI